MRTDEHRRHLSRPAGSGSPQGDVLSVPEIPDRAHPHLRGAHHRGPAGAVSDLLDGHHVAETAARDLPAARAVAAGLHPRQLRKAPRRRRLSDRHPQQPHRRHRRHRDLGADLLVRGLLDGAVPLPVSRLDRAADSLRLPDARLAAVHSALDRDGAVEARQFAWLG